MKSVALSMHKTLKDLKGLLFLFKNDDNQVTMKSFTSIFYHLSTFNHSLKERQSIQGSLSVRMKLEIKFEEELWY